MRQARQNWEDLGIPQDLWDHAKVLIKHFVRQKLFSMVKFITTEQQLLNTGMYFDIDLLFCNLLTIFLFSLQMIAGKNSVAAMVCKHLKFPIESWHLFADLVYDTIRIKRSNVTTILRRTYQSELVFVV
jgi:hypothetical protein